MKYQADHDLHIHSYISPCARHDPRQTKEAILAYGIASGFKLLCVTDHIWDKKGPGYCALWRGSGLDIEKGKEILPLPQSPLCRFLFGMEVDMDFDGNIAVTEPEYDTFDFLILSPSHLHMKDQTIDPKKVGPSAPEHKKYYQERIFRFLSIGLPLRKCGLAHFTTSLACREDPYGMLELFSNADYEEIFKEVARSGMGMELNFEDDYEKADEKQKEQVLRPYRIAKECGCTFYFGSDAHTPEGFAGRRAHFEWVIDTLGLEEKDKFPLIKEYIGSKE